LPSYKYQDWSQGIFDELSNLKIIGVVKSKMIMIMIAIFRNFDDVCKGPS